MTKRELLELLAKRHRRRLARLPRLITVPPVRIRLVATEKESVEAPIPLQSA